MHRWGVGEHEAAVVGCPRGPLRPVGGSARGRSPCHDENDDNEPEEPSERREEERDQDGSGGHVDIVATASHEGEGLLAARITFPERRRCGKDQRRTAREVVVATCIRSRDDRVWFAF